MILRPRPRPTPDPDQSDIRPEADVTPLTSASALAEVVDRLPIGVFAVDEEGFPVALNRAAREYTTGVRGEAIVEVAVNRVAAAVTRGEAEAQSVNLYGPPKRSFEVSGIVFPRPVHGQVGIVLVEDTTELTRLEQIRRDFVANVSHELKTPVGALSLLAETLCEEDDEEAKERLATRIVAEARRLADLVDGLLELARTEGGKGEDLPIQVRSIVTEAVERVRPVAERRETAVDVSLPPEVLYVRGDRLQLVSALANLVDNAVKFSPPGSRVDVAVEYDSRHVSLVVTDRGPGIPASDLPRIFERFYRVDPSRGRSTGGSGLGLAIVKHVAATHGGEVSVDSRLGEGSTFRLVLPRLGDPRDAFEVDGFRARHEDSTGERFEGPEGAIDV
ncbi:MAG: two-component sensor histidine kinase [Acidimicrobiales bacterium]|nr:MAG: two-component sensor histidine kinase [Acidimicrobiales bacterium]